MMYYIIDVIIKSNHWFLHRRADVAEIYDSVRAFSIRRGIGTDFAKNQRI